MNHLSQNNRGYALVGTKKNSNDNNNTTTATLNVLYSMFDNHYICVDVWSSVCQN